MEIQPLTIETIFKVLQERTGKTPVIVDARIALSPQEARLLDFKPSAMLEVIQY
jgi:hypothetical protein